MSTKFSKNMGASFRDLGGGRILKGVSVRAEIRYYNPNPMKPQLAHTALPH